MTHVSFTDHTEHILEEHGTDTQERNRLGLSREAYCSKLGLKYPFPLYPDPLLEGYLDKAKKVKQNEGPINLEHE